MVLGVSTIQFLCETNKNSWRTNFLKIISFGKKTHGCTTLKVMKAILKIYPTAKHTWDHKQIKSKTELKTPQDRFPGDGDGLGSILAKYTIFFKFNNFMNSSYFGFLSFLLVCEELGENSVFLYFSHSVFFQKFNELCVEWNLSCTNTNSYGTCKHLWHNLYLSKMIVVKFQRVTGVDSYFFNENHKKCTQIEAKLYHLTFKKLS